VARYIVLPTTIGSPSCPRSTPVENVQAAFSVLTLSAVDLAQRAVASRRGFLFGNVTLVVSARGDRPALGARGHWPDDAGVDPLLHPAGQRTDDPNTDEGGTSCRRFVSYGDFLYSEDAALRGQCCRLSVARCDCGPITGERNNLERRRFVVAVLELRLLVRMHEGGSALRECCGADTSILLSILPPGKIFPSRWAGEPRWAGTTQTRTNHGCSVRPGGTDMRADGTAPIEDVIPRATVTGPRRIEDRLAADNRHSHVAGLCSGWASFLGSLLSNHSVGRRNQPTAEDSRGRSRTFRRATSSPWIFTIRRLYASNVQRRNGDSRLWREKADVPGGARPSSKVISGMAGAIAPRRRPPNGNRRPEASRGPSSESTNIVIKVDRRQGGQHAPEGSRLGNDNPQRSNTIGGCRPLRRTIWSR
jgi:hypothetical protein